MKTGNLILLEALFIPEARRTLAKLMECLTRKSVPADLLREHLKLTNRVKREIHDDLHSKCHPKYCSNHGPYKEIGEEDVDFESLIVMLYQYEAHLRNRAALFLGTIKPADYRDIDEEEMEKWDALSDSERAVRQLEMQKVAQATANKIKKADQRSKNGAKGNKFRASDAQKRIREAKAALLQRGEAVTNKSLAKEGKLSPATIRKYSKLWVARR